MNTPVVDKKPRLTTSAMIASIASEGQRVTAAPFGKALVAYAADHPEVVDRLTALAEAARAELGDNRLKRIGSGVREPGRIE